MKHSIKLIGAALLCFHLITACSDNKPQEQQAAAETAGASGSSSLFGKSTEEKVDDFLNDYVKDLKAAMDEKDDQKAISLLKEMKAEYAPRATELEPEVKEWEKSLSENEQESLEKRMGEKPYIKELISIGFTAATRFNKTPELQKAFEDLNSSIDIGASDETEIIPEDEMMEEEGAEEESSTN